MYGTVGAAFSDGAHALRLKKEDETTAQFVTAESLEPHFRDPFAYLAAVVRGVADPTGGFSSISVNTVAMEIHDAALRSAREGRPIVLDDAE